MKNSSPKRNFNYDYIAIGFIYVISIVFLLTSKNIKDADSRIFPLFVSSLSIVLSTILLLRNIFGRRKKEEYDFTGTNRALWMTVALLLFIVAITFVGFYIAAPVYLYLTMRMLGQKNQKTLILVSLIAPISVYLFFDLLFSMPIPRGMLFPNLFH